jgi:hypothetical protein
VLFRRFLEDAGQRYDPDPRALPETAGVAIPIGEYHRQLAAVLVTELAGIQCEGRSKRPCAPTAPLTRVALHVSLP